jgi:hypothetical protein
MAYIHDLDYYGGNENNQRYLESLTAAKAAPAATASQPIDIASEVKLAQSLLAQLQADSLTNAQQAVVSAAEVAAQLVPVPPANPPAWKAKA